MIIDEQVSVYLISYPLIAPNGMVLPLSIVPYATVSSLLCDSMPVIATGYMTDKISCE